MEQNEQFGNKPAQAKSTCKNPGQCSVVKTWPFRLIFGLLVATLIVAIVVVSVRRGNGGSGINSGWRVATINLTEDAECTDDNITDYSGPGEVRCLTDNDIQTISQATYDPMSTDEAENSVNDNGELSLNNASDVKRFLDYAITAKGSSNLNVTLSGQQFASTIDTDGDDYAYTFYINQPARADCYWNCPEGVNCFVQPRRQVEVGGKCGDGEWYVETRGQTRAGELRISQSNPTVKLNNSGKIHIDAYDDIAETLVHDAKRNLNYVDFDGRYKALTN